MKYFGKISPVLVLGMLLVDSLFAQDQSTSASNTYVFSHVNVIPMDREQVLENYHVIIQGDRITSLGPSAEVQIPAGAEEIDGRGKYLMPGLAEMHGHIPGEEQRQYAQDVLFLYIANGVTTVRNMLGTMYQLQLKEMVENGALPGPKIYAASPWLSRDAISNAEAASKIVREHKAAGFDLLKIGNLDPEAYEQMASTAHQINMPFGGHIPEPVGLEGALAARQTSIDHYDRYVEFLVPETVKEGRNNGFFGSGIIDLIDRNRIPDAIAMTIEAGTWNVPTLSLVEHLASEEAAEDMITRPEMKYMPKRILDDWVKAKHDFEKRADFQPEATRALVDFRRELTRELHQAGAPIVLGSDAPQFFNVPGFSIHHELEMMVNSGLSPFEVLVTGTKNAAAYFGTPEEFGSIQEGRRADLILLNVNPLEDISHIQDRDGVMVRGQWYPEQKIQEKLKEIEDRNR